MDVNVDHKSLFDKCRYWYIVQYSNFISTKIHRKIPEHAPKICGKRVLTLASV
jgi:hypothetical protein